MTETAATVRAELDAVLDEIAREQRAQDYANRRGPAHLAEQRWRRYCARIDALQARRWALSDQLAALAYDEFGNRC